MSPEPTLTEILRQLDYPRACIRCLRVLEEESAVITPWVVKPDGVTTCVGIYVTFLCWPCREVDDSAAADILTLDNNTRQEIVEDENAFKGLKFK